MSGVERAGVETLKDSDVWVKAVYCGEDRIGLPVYEPFDVRDVIPHSDALPPVARWLAEFGAEALNGLIDAGTFCLNDGGEIVFDDPAYQAQLVAAGRALITALTGGGEGAGGD